MSEVINAEQCAQLLQCTEQRVEELTRNGDLPGMKYGRSWIFVKADLLVYIAERARKESEERRVGRHARLSAPSLAASVKPRRRIPPPLPALPECFVPRKR